MISVGGAYARYIYDNNGNLIIKTSGIMKPISYAAELTTEDLPNFGLVIKRDSENGTGSGDITLNTYDHYNRLISTESRNSSATYRYNA